jgi:hypothetical protein
MNKLLLFFIEISKEIKKILNFTLFSEGFVVKNLYAEYGTTLETYTYRIRYTTLKTYT